MKSYIKSSSHYQSYNKECSFIIKQLARALSALADYEAIFDIYMLVHAAIRTSDDDIIERWDFSRMLTRFQRTNRIFNE